MVFESIEDSTEKTEFFVSQGHLLTKKQKNDLKSKIILDKA